MAQKQPVPRCGRGWGQAVGGVQESGKEKDSVGCQGREVSASRYQWEGAMAEQVYLRGMAGAYSCPM